MRKKLIKEYDELVNELMEVSYDEEWDEIIEYSEESYDVAIIILKAKLKSKLNPYTKYEDDEEDEEIFYMNAYNFACSIQERSKFLWPARDPVILYTYIIFNIKDIFNKLFLKRRC